MPESAWRTKHLAPDTSRPVTHLVDRPRDRGKDRWMENSMAGGGEVGGGNRYCRFGEAAKENKDHVFTRDARGRRNALDESILLTASSFHPDQTATMSSLSSGHYTIIAQQH